MKIIIPMAGVGQRFVDAGFTEIKPLIDIEGVPAIVHIVEMFGEGNDFVFVCNKDHQDTTPLDQVLNDTCPTGKVVWMDSHKKGPVYSTLSALDYVDDGEEVFVNYCDLINRWSFSDLVCEARELNYDGALSAFRGFHPVSLGHTDDPSRPAFAHMRVNGRNECLEVAEKRAFTDNRLNEFSSAGGHYFSRGRYLKKYFNEAIQKDIQVNGEYYVSLVFNLMIEDGLKVKVHEIDQHIGFGTPEDYYQYTFWSGYFRDIADAANNRLELENTTTCIPAAGPLEKSLWGDYKLPKPLIPVTKKPMFKVAIESLPQTDSLVMICLKEHADEFNFDYFFHAEYPEARVVLLAEATTGMASTCMQAHDFFDSEQALIVSGCDFSLRYDSEKLKSLISDDNNDVIMFSYTGQRYVRRDPLSYTYLQLNEGRVAFVSEKATISNDPRVDSIFAGAVYFRTATLFINAVKKMMREGKTIKGKYYVATAINELIKDEFRVVPFEVERFVTWSRALNLQEFEYWERYYDTSDRHPYQKIKATIIRNGGDLLV
ncbi:NTP transferase domain-containing protein [Gammaproteobacteria bacterium]|nr:NTP transferase domain-containing protein [Gammaproteobacteria bacterium]